MTQKGFSGGWFDLGNQMAQTWQTFLESWWQALLSDPARLGELARKLFERPEAASRQDLARLVEALELVEKRLTKLEHEQKLLAEQLAGRQGAEDAR